jgi:hypothetical protein
MVERAEGDLFLAEQLAQTIPPKGKRLSADRANAARLAWQGNASLDQQSGDDDTALIFTLIAPQDEAQDVIRPKVGRGAAAEALAVLRSYVTTPRDTQARTELLGALRGVASGADVDILEEHITLPREAFARKAVLSALGILRSYVSTIADGVLADDLRSEADDRSDDRAAKNGTVNAVLGAMDARAHVQAEALRYSYGIADHTCYGTGDSGDLDGLADALGVSAIQARDARSRGHKGFAKRYIAAIATDQDHALALSAVAAERLGRGGRK